MSITCKIGDVVRVYRHHLKDCIGIVGTVGYIGKEVICVNILGKGPSLIEKAYLAHVKKETTVIVGVHSDDAFYNERNTLTGKQCSIVMEYEPVEEGYYSGKVNIPNRGDLSFYAANLHTYNKGKK